MTSQRISIVTPSLNQAQYLESTIRSILGQNYPDLEYVIIDGGSTDGSVDIIRKYEGQLAYWVSEPDTGQGEAINKGFRHTTGEILTWLNSDDMLLPGALSLVSDLFAKNPEIAWLTGRSCGIDAPGRICELGPPMGHPRLMIRLGWYHGRSVLGFIQQEGTFWRRALWERAEGRLETERHYSMDFDLWQRFAAHASLVTVDSVLAAFRYHPARKSAGDRIDRYYAEAGVRQPKYPEFVRPFALRLRELAAMVLQPFAPRVAYKRSTGEWHFAPGSGFRPGVR